MQTANRGDTLKPLERMLPARRRLEWAVDYVESDLARLPLWRLEELRKDLRLFVGFFVGVEASEDLVGLPSDGDMQQTQEGLREMITAGLNGKPTGGSYRAEWSLVYMPRMATGPDDVEVDRPLEPHLAEYGKHDMPVPELAKYQLATLIVEQARAGVTIKQCPGPIPRRPHVSCGRWFVGTPKKRYCSPRCQMRATDRARRARAS
jgi:hypothetical protein